MVEITLPIVLQLFQTVGILVGIYYYIMTLRNANKARWKDILLQRINTLDDDFYTRWRTYSLRDVNTYEEWLEYDEENPEAYGFISYASHMLNSIGALLKDNMVDPDSLFSVYSPIIVIWTWERYKVITEYYREHIKLPTYLENFEYLYHEAKRRFPMMVSREEWHEFLNERETGT